MNSIVQNIQTRNNAQAAVNNQYETSLRALDYQNQVDKISSTANALKRQRGQLAAQRYDATSQEELNAIDNRMSEIDAELGSQAEKLAKLRGTIDQARSEARETNRGQSLFGIFANGGKLLSH